MKNVVNFYVANFYLSNLFMRKLWLSKQSDFWHADSSNMIFGHESFTRKRRTKRLKHTGNLFRKNL